MLRRFMRLAAWILLSVIVLLSAVPSGARPITTFPHAVEHAIIFWAVGMLFGAAYLGHERMLSIGAVAFCATLELTQLLIPGRHARLSDFIVDTTAALVGVFLGSALYLVYIISRPRPPEKIRPVRLLVARPRSEAGANFSIRKNQ
jgi:VanZ family protein